MTQEAISMRLTISTCHVQVTRALPTRTTLGKALFHRLGIDYLLQSIRHHLLEISRVGYSISSGQGNRQFLIEDEQVVAALSPYVCQHINRIGRYQLDLWQLSETEWLLALRRPAPVPRKK
jgi:hypothetical protein